MSSSGKIKDLGNVFQFFAGAYGDKIVYSSCKAETFGYYTSGNPWATDFNALAPDQDAVPMLGQMVSKKDDMLYILLINRTSDRRINTNIDLGVTPSLKKATVRILSGNDIDLPGANVSENTIDVARRFTQSIEPYSAQIIMVKVK
jgi:alpha-L-arabinofuranosidase